MEQIFGPDWELPFRNCPSRLRFELGGEELPCVEAPVPRFVQALLRARTIFNSVFAGSTSLFAIVCFHKDTALDFFAPVENGFVALSRIGFTAEFLTEWNARLEPRDEEQDPQDFLWRAFDVAANDASCDALLWSSISYEMSIEPKVPAIVYFIDFENEILLHVYDDRGMDVSALSQSTLQQCYTEFDPWLLDYDRPRMATAFAG